MNRHGIINSAKLLTLTAITLVMLSSCKDTADEYGVATVEIVLLSENQTESVADAYVKVNCMTEGDNAETSIEANRTTEGIYVATLPAGCSPAQPFIEVDMGNDTLSYSVSDICFENGHSYRYSLTVGRNGNQLPDTGITVEGWGIVNMELEL